MSCRLQSELLWYECWLSSVPFIDTAWSKLHCCMTVEREERYQFVPDMAAVMCVGLIN